MNRVGYWCRHHCEDELGSGNPVWDPNRGSHAAEDAQCHDTHKISVNIQNDTGVRAHKRHSRSIFMSNDSFTETHAAANDLQKPAIEISDCESDLFDLGRDCGFELANYTIKTLIDHRFSAHPPRNFKLDSEHAPSHSIQDGYCFFPGETKYKQLAQECKTRKYRSIKVVIDVSQGFSSDRWFPIGVLSAWKAIAYAQTVQREYTTIQARLSAARLQLTKDEQKGADAILELYVDVAWNRTFNIAHDTGIQLHELRRILGADWLNDSCITALQHVLVSRISNAHEDVARTNAILPFMAIHMLLNDFENSVQPNRQLSLRNGDRFGLQEIIRKLSSDCQLRVYLFGHVSGCHWAAFTIDNATKQVFHGM